MLDVAAFYRFSSLPDPAAGRAALEPVLDALGLTGTLILAPEGVNGTLAGARDALDAGLEAIAALAGPLRPNRSTCETSPFGRLRLRVKREIVTMGVPETDPTRRVGTYVAPRDWNALIGAGDVVVIDTRNTYEVALGSFAGAVDPGIATFRDFPAWWRAQAGAMVGKRVAMFCTGGIRCEKATSLALAEGAQGVFHLEGGILRYLDEVAPEESLWRGECFVFDDRVAVGPGSVQGGAVMCRACGHPHPAGERCRCGAEG